MTGGLLGQTELVIDDRDMTLPLDRAEFPERVDGLLRFDD